MNHKINLAIQYLKKINIWKTIYFNFHYFPFKVAKKLPIFVCKRTQLSIIKGKIVIDAPITTGMLVLGSHGIGTQDIRYSRTIWEMYGTVILSGKASIGRGCKISVGKEGVLKIGENFKITGDTAIICQKEVVFGKNCLLSWDILVMDTDFHRILNKNGDIINPNKSIIIGNHVWIGCRNTILKGCTIGNNTVISANSTITKSFYEENCIIGGNGKNAEIIKRNISWEG